MSILKINFFILKYFKQKNILKNKFKLLYSTIFIKHVHDLIVRM
jgi:hypothetical protein